MSGTIWEIDPCAVDAESDRTSEIPAERVIAGMRSLGAETTAFVVLPGHCSTESSVDCVRRHHIERADEIDPFGYWK